MTTHCPSCQAENSSQAHFCAQCGSVLPAREGKKAALQRTLNEAALSVDELVTSPAVQDITRKVGDAMQQAGDGIDRALKSDGTQRALHQIGNLAEQAVKAVKEPFSSGKTPQAPVDLSSAAMPLRPCLRCGAQNRPDGRFCAMCGISLEHTPERLHYSVAQLSEIGQVRSNNEDNIGAWSFAAQGLAAWTLLVADGMGGAASGEVASQCVVDVVTQEIGARWNAKDPQPVDLERWLRGVLRQANSAVFRQAQSDPALYGMGSTATLVWLEDDLITVAHVGDSRAYLIPPAGPFWQITQDHTMVALLASIGEMTAEEAATSPQNNLLYKAIGIAPKVEVDSYRRRVVAGDHILLCSDGLTRHVPPDEMAAVVRRTSDPAAACQALVALANQRGGEDNISVIVAQAHAASATSGD